jgi:branched-chain amino acid aminotransferase
MAIQQTEKVWHNGKLVPWDDAKIHVMSHVVNYGSSVFEGIRCYALPSGPAIFRANEHIQRLIDSARIYRIDVDFTRDEIVAGMVETIKNNGVWPCYIRPIILQFADRGLYLQLSLGEIPRHRRRAGSGCLRFVLDPNRAEHFASHR